MPAIRSLGNRHGEPDSGETFGLADRGTIAAGKRADLVSIRLAGDLAFASSVWICRISDRQVGGSESG
jgi:hypothetical protein